MYICNSNSGLHLPIFANFERVIDLQVTPLVVVYELHGSNLAFISHHSIINQLIAQFIKRNASTARANRSTYIEVQNDWQ